MNFEDWIKDIEEETDKIHVMMEQSLPDAPEQLADELRQTEAWHAWLTTQLAYANSYLDKAEYAESRKPEYADETMVDRKIRMRGEVAKQREIRNVLDGLCEAIRTRIMLGMSLLKASAGERIANATIEKTF